MTLCTPHVLSSARSIKPSCAPALLISRTNSRITSQLVRSMVSKDSLPDQYKDDSKYKLQFVCFTRLAPEQTTANFQELLPDHLSWLRSLDDQGQLAFHGNFLNPEASNYGSGMYALFCDSTSDAKQLAEQDPLHKKGVRRFEMLPWVQQVKWE